jgi:hypothetical protein
VNLDELLGVFDRAAANLSKLEAVWKRAYPLLPQGPARGSVPEYDDLARAWADLLPGLPAIDRWRIEDELPDMAALGQAFVDYIDIGEHPFSVYEAIEKPGRDLAEYRYRLHRARRRATQQRLQTLIDEVETTLSTILRGFTEESYETRSPRFWTDDSDRVEQAIGEIERLLGDTIERRGRWGDLYRHLHFAQPHDWRDIATMDWPSVRADVDLAAFSDIDPLPVPDIDLGVIATAGVSGTASTALDWTKLSDNDFERLLYDLLRSFPDHENVSWLMATRAPDRGRDLSLDRVIRDGTGNTRHERVIVQAKHWTTKSVNVPAVSETLANMELWTPPVVRVLIIATSGRFTADAVSWIERRNETGTAPMIEMWPDSRLESLLSQRPGIAAAHGLR